MEFKEKVGTVLIRKFGIGTYKKYILYKNSERLRAATSNYQRTQDNRHFVGFDKKNVEFALGLFHIFTFTLLIF